MLQWWTLGAVANGDSNLTTSPDGTALPRPFGDYVLHKQLGQGGMGDVFLASLKARGLVGIDKPCVLKTLRPNNDAEYERRFVDEARLIVLLTHRNICPVFDAGCFEGMYYLAMEHVDGRDLRAAQKACERRGAPLPTDVVIHIVKEVCEGLDAAHRMVHPMTKEPLHVVHRDISPQNVMLSGEGEVKLIDFGLAISSQKLERTAPQIVMGKMAYMAPEQARGDAVDTRADQFAVGVLLYEMLTNTRYYDGLGIDGIWRIAGIGGHQPASISGLSPDLAAIIQRATHPDREKRFAACGDMRDALTAVELDRGVLAGSREVRAALTSLTAATVDEAWNLPSLEAVVPVPPPAPPRERTRTFRVIPADDTRSDVAVVEDAPPGSLITDDQLRPVVLPTESASAIAAPAPPPREPAQKPAVAGPRPVEATVVVRGFSMPTAAAAPEQPPAPRRAPIFAAVAVLGALVVVGIALVSHQGTSDGTAVDAGQVVVTGAIPLPAFSVDAGILVDGDAGFDAGKVDAEGSIPNDAGTDRNGPDLASEAPSETPAEASDAGVDGDTNTNTNTNTLGGAPKDGGDLDSDVKDATKPRIKRPKPRRKVPPLPNGTFFDRFKHLKKHCADVPCFANVQNGINQTDLTPARLDDRLSQCFKTCQTRPPP